MPYDKGSHWDGHSEQWRHIGSPLRPCAQDVDFFRNALKDSSGRKGLLLGVTPELVSIADMTALDHNPFMVSKVANGAAVIGEWLDMPFADSSFDFAVGDGCLNMLSYPYGYTQFFQQLQRVVKPNGLVSFRLFAAPLMPEPLDLLVEEAHSGRIGSFHAFKWRWAMAMTVDRGDPNIPVDDILKTFHHHFPDRVKLSSSSGWDLQSIQTIDVYGESEMSYSFPTLKQMQDVEKPYLQNIGIQYGSYELAERCPILTYRLSA